MEIGLVGDQVKQWEQGLEVNKLVIGMGRIGSAVAKDSKHWV